MANKNLLKKIAPVILSATVAMTGMPSACLLQLLQPNFLLRI